MNASKGMGLQCGWGKSTSRAARLRRGVGMWKVSRHGDALTAHHNNRVRHGRGKTAIKKNAKLAMSVKAKKEKDEGA